MSRRYQCQRPTGGGHAPPAHTLSPPTTMAPSNAARRPSPLGKRRRCCRRLPVCRYGRHVPDSKWGPDHPFSAAAACPPVESRVRRWRRGSAGPRRMHLSWGPVLVASIARSGAPRSSPVWPRRPPVQRPGTARWPGSFPRRHQRGRRQRWVSCGRWYLAVCRKRAASYFGGRLRSAALHDITSLQPEFWTLPAEIRLSLTCWYRRGTEKGESAVPLSASAAGSSA